MPYYCTVPRCTSMAGKAKNVSFHQFPRDEELARLWNCILKRGKPYTKYSKVCSLHFRPEDYTITSVGKNKGQWRTLRKDAVPSQNLPSETPAPYSRKQWESYSQNSCTPSVMDPAIHQHMAQAIYMQTMLAMQAAGTTETPHHNGPPIPPGITPHSSSHEEVNKEPNKDSISYKCEECTKCFKDPDVFILHQRSHSRDLKSNGVEKENFNMNLTLRSNPILANLLKTNNEANFDPNLITMENLLMTALAANMDYLRNISMGKERECDGLNSDRGDSNHDRTDSNDLNHLHSDLNGSTEDSELKDLRDVVSPNDSDHVRAPDEDRRVISYTQCLSNTRNEQSLKYVEFGDIKGDRNNINNENSVLGEQNDIVNHSKSDLNHLNEQKLQDSEQNRQNSDSNLSDQVGLSYAMNFSTKLSDRGVDSVKYSGNYYRERCFSDEYDRDESNSDDKTKNIQNNVKSHYDNDLSESLDSNISNSLVIDENA